MNPSIAGGLISGASGAVGSIIDAITGAVNAKKQRQHDQDMAALNQKNALEQMAVQNQYQLDQWNRENEYNDPSAVAERYREAGINPRAALEGAAKGAGVAGGLSSAPHGSSTGHASNIQFDTNFGSSLSSSITAGLTAGSNMQYQMASANKVTKEAEGIAIDNKHKEQKTLNDLEKQKAEITKILEDTNLSKAQREVYNKQVDVLDQQINESKKTVEKLAADITKSKYENAQTLANIGKTTAEIQHLQTLDDVNRSIVALNNDKVETERTQQALNKAKTTHTEQDTENMRKRIDVELDMMMANTDLSLAEIRKIKADITHEFVSLGKEIVFDTVHEFRSWLFTNFDMALKLLHGVKDVSKSKK